MNPAACTFDVVAAAGPRWWRKEKHDQRDHGHRAAQVIRRQIILDGIDLEVGAGTTFSLLGPDGAGKTTTVQIMSTLVHADGKRTKQRFTGWVR